MAYGQNGEKWTSFYLANDIGSLPVGTRLLRQPPHVTETPPCDIENVRLQEMDQYLAELAGQTEAIALKSIGLMFVGHRNKPTLATRFEKTEALVDFHEALISGLGRIGCDFISLEWARGCYTPHSEGVLLDHGEELQMNNITVFTKRRNPIINGLDEVTARYELRQPAQ